MISPVIVAVDEGCDLGFEIARQEVVLQQDSVLERLVPALDLALGLRVARRAAGVIDVAILQPVGQLAGDVARPIVGKQPWPLPHRRAIAARRHERQVQRVGDVLGLHGGAQLPGDDVTGEVVEDGGQVKPAQPMTFR